MPKRVTISGQLLALMRLSLSNGPMVDSTQQVSLKLRGKKYLPRRGGSPKRILSKPAEKSFAPFSIVATTKIGMVSGKLTKNCFVGSRWASRDADFDKWLPAKQPKAGKCVIATLAPPSRNWTYAESVSAILSISADVGPVVLGNSLIEHGHTMTLVQADEMVDKTEFGVKTEMQNNYGGNIFFEETGDPKNPIAVGSIVCDGHDWRAYIDEFDDDVKLTADYRILIRNPYA